MGGRTILSPSQKEGNSDSLQYSLDYGDISIAEGFSPSEHIVIAEGDCAPVLKDLPDNTFKLIISSPPYNLDKDYEEQQALDEYLCWVGIILDELVRVLHEDGSLCWQVGNYVDAGEVYPLDILFYPQFKDRGLKLRNRVIWHFGHGLHAKKRFSGRYETLLWFTKGDQYTFNLDPVRIPSKYPGKRHYKGPNRGKPSGNPLGKNPSDFWEIVARDWENCVWDIPNVKANHPEKTNHPCQFPIALIERCVLALTDKNDWVLDPFSGVGSALIASLMHSRRAMGCEKEPTYVSIAKERIREFYCGSLPYRHLGKPIHEPSGNEKVARRPNEWDE